MVAGVPGAEAIVPTGDGSATLRSARYGETYHSIHGAARESLVATRAALPDARIPVSGTESASLPER